MEIHHNMYLYIKKNIYNRSTEKTCLTRHGQVLFNMEINVYDFVSCPFIDIF